MTGHANKQSASANMRFVYGQLRPYRGIAIAVVISAAFAGALDSMSIGLLVPLLATLQTDDTGSMPAALELFNSLFASLGISPSIAVVVTAVLIAIAGKNLLLLLTYGIAYRLSSRVLANVRGQMAEQLMQVGISFHDRRRASDLADIWYNKAKALELVIGHGVNLAANALTGLALFTLLFFLSWKLTVIAILLSLAGILLLRAHTRAADAAGKRLVQSERSLMASMYDNLAGIRLIRTTGAGPKVLRRFSGKNEDNARQLSYGNFLVYAIQPVSDLLGSVGIAVLALLALGILELSPAATVTLLLPFLYVLLRLVPIAKMLSNQRSRIAHLWPNVDEIRQLLQAGDKPVIADGHQPFAGLGQEIYFDNVSFSYSGSDTPVLDGASFSIPAGKTTAIIGETGSGKSTIAHLLLRLYDPDGGQILVDGLPLKDLQLDTLYRQISLVGQETTLFNASIRANLEFTADRELNDAGIAEAARMAGIDSFIEALPQGYDTLVGDNGLRLSGGQRQRLAIARALLRNPGILILDEATSALDNRTELWIRESIEKFAADRTLVIIAHRLSTIEHADHVVVLKHGQVAESGALSQVKYSGGEYARLAADGS